MLFMCAYWQIQNDCDAVYVCMYLWVTEKWTSNSSDSLSSPQKYMKINGIIGGKRHKQNTTTDRKKKSLATHIKPRKRHPTWTNRAVEREINKKKCIARRMFRRVLYGKWHIQIVLVGMIKIIHLHTQLYCCCLNFINRRSAVVEAVVVVWRRRADELICEQAVPSTRTQ